jgi:hypothetical protein
VAIPAILEPDANGSQNVSDLIAGRWHNAVVLIDHPFLRAKQLLRLDSAQNAEELCHGQLKTFPGLAMGAGSLHWAHEQEVCASLGKGPEDASVIRRYEPMYKWKT